MDQRRAKWRMPDQPGGTEDLLVSYFSHLLKWGLALTRGDRAKAEEIVQEFCLYFTLTKPDLSDVANLEGYLYTCLRHIYLSVLARSSREATHFVSIADFDSFEFALASRQSSDPLQRQNDIRRICGYTIWRKEFSKSASYFILHFFHGYSRRETAELARVPLSAIYNKLKIARSEVKSYLGQPSKLRIVSRDLPPEPSLSWSLLPTTELFVELRETILHACHSECLPEQELIAQYGSPVSQPMDCLLLAHVVSCDRCLAMIDRHFRRPTLHDRETLDGFDSEASNASVVGSNTSDQRAILRSIRRRWGIANEHRPRTLSIAVNGKVIAFHDVQAEHSSLSARIEHPEKAQFIEVFSEQDVRFALMSVGDPPPEGLHVRTQRVALSDSRWLELNLTFDGLGLSSQVAYHDPALAIESIEEEQDLSVVRLQKLNDSISPAHGIFPWIAKVSRRLFRPMVPSSAMAWALILVAVFSAMSYIAFRHTSAPIDANEVLSQSVSIESVALKGQTEHEILQLEEVSSDGQVLQQGTVDIWRDGDGGRYLRRLYDSDHHMIAAKWRNKDGEHSSNGHRSDGDASGLHHSSSMNGWWDRDLSARAFSMMGDKKLQVHVVGGNYELTIFGPFEDSPQLMSTTLVLDRHFTPVGQTIRIETGSQIHELRFVRASYERKPSISVSDFTFDPDYDSLSPQNLHSPTATVEIVPQSALATNTQLARLQIAVLYRLSGLDSDTGEPIEVNRTPNGRIRVAGVVGDNSLKQRIVSNLESLQDYRLLDLRLVSPGDVRISGVPRITSQNTSVYEVGQAKPLVDPILRKYFQSKGVSSNQLDSTIERYSHEALQHAQSALQHAYALNRLGNTLSDVELYSIGISSQREWAEMVNKHAKDLEEQLRALEGQLADVAPSDNGSVDLGVPSLTIENSDQFKRSAAELLQQTQTLNSGVGRLFTSNGSVETQPTQDSPLRTTISAIPLKQAERISHFAAELNTSEQFTLNNREHGKREREILEPPK